MAIEMTEGPARTGGPKEPVIKARPADFLVRESMLVDLVPVEKATQRYFLLRKQGYTTFTAIGLIADQLGVPRKAVTYGGLKDEDGITEQLVAIDMAFASRAFTTTGGPEQWLELHPYGHGGKALQIGELCGNSFRITVRNLDDFLTSQLSETTKLNLFFINYYDTQRFGVPDGPKQTHLVGAAILGADWATALERVRTLRTPESPAAREWAGSPQEFFKRLDQRIVSFYLAAAASFDWNARLRSTVEQVCGTDHRNVRLHDLNYAYTASPESALRVLMARQEIPMPRYSFDVDGLIKKRESTRRTVVQTDISVSKPASDELFPGTARVELTFFLPSGCYATTAVRQLLTYFSSAPSHTEQPARDDHLV